MDNKSQEIASYTRSLIEASLDPLVTIASNGKITDVNLATEQITGYSKDDLIGTDFADYFTEPAKAKAGYLEVYEKGSVRDCFLELKHKNGHATSVLYNASVYKGRTGNVIGVFAAARDISQQKRLESEVAVHTKELISEKELAEQASLAKSRFLSSMSHELRTPLNAIIGFSQLLESDTESPLNQDQLESITLIHESGNALLELISNALELSDLESGQTQIKLEAVDITSLISKSCYVMEKQARAQSITLEKDTISRPYFLLADSHKLQQVLIHFISNAIKYNHHGGHVTLSYAKTANNKIRVSVFDTGKGVPDDFLTSIFNSFNRLDRSSSGIHGLGVGLTICKKLVELMSGNIGAELNEKEGMTFWCEFDEA